MTKASSAALALMVVSPVVFASFFFTMNDSIQVGCLETKVRTKEEAIRTIEQSGTVKCTAVTDVNGDFLLTCKGFVTTIHFFSDDRARCERTFASMKRLIGK